MSSEKAFEKEGKNYAKYSLEYALGKIVHVESNSRDDQMGRSIFLYHQSKAQIRSADWTRWSVFAIAITFFLGFVFEYGYKILVFLKACLNYIQF